MKIAFITTRTDKPSFKYRVSQYIPFLSNKGFITSTLLYPKNIFFKINFFIKLKSYDLIFIHRKLPNFIDRFFIKFFAKIIIFDFDDAIMFRQTGNKNITSFMRETLFEKTIKLSNIVIAGNDYLKKQAIPFNKNTFIIPTPVDMNRYNIKPYDENKSLKICIGWIGSKSTLIYLQDFIPIFKQLYEKHNNIILKIVSNGTINEDNLPIINKEWSHEEEISDLHSFDIGIMPLSDDPWSKGKCGFKLIQYMACGIPSICSPVGINNEIVEDGVNGFHAKNKDEWLNKCEQLILSKNLRIELGIKARETILKKYSLHVNAEILINILNKYHKIILNSDF